MSKFFSEGCPSVRRLLNFEFFTFEQVDILELELEIENVSRQLYASARRADTQVVEDWCGHFRLDRFKSVEVL